ncbi:hypothetical protein Sjap_017993 [Stephania japonica]|uniref:Uncharacterized protein n=1 Tax=Stephania japonica TaxID=461633 RepID=A0AAP0I760_9MAGN
MRTYNFGAHYHHGGARGALVSRIVHLLLCSPSFPAFTLVRSSPLHCCLRCLSLHDPIGFQNIPDSFEQFVMCEWREGWGNVAVGLGGGEEAVLARRWSDNLRFVFQSEQVLVVLSDAGECQDLRPGELDHCVGFEA